ISIAIEVRGELIKGMGASMVETQSVTARVQTSAVQVIDLLRSELQTAQAETFAKTRELAVEAASLASAANLALVAAATTTATVALDIAQRLPRWASAVAIAFALLLLISAIRLAGRGQVEPRVSMDEAAEAGEDAAPLPGRC